jgi:hypothetical protein
MRNGSIYTVHLVLQKGTWTFFVFHLLEVHVDRAKSMHIITRPFIHGDSKLLSGFPWPINGSPDNNVESSCIIDIPSQKFVLLIIFERSGRFMVHLIQMLCWTLSIVCAIKDGLKVSYVISKLYIKVHKTFIYYLLIYKNCSKWDPPYWVHNSQLCDTVLRLDRQV